MGFLDKIFPLNDVERIKTSEQSHRLLVEYVGSDRVKFVGFKNHKKVREGSPLVPAEADGNNNFYVFTLKVLSQDFLNKVSNDKRVKNLFYAAAAPPPGGGMDATTFRYKVYIEYY